MNTDHFYTAQRITGLMAEDSIQSQAQELYEQKKLRRQMNRLIRAVDEHTVDEQILDKEEAEKNTAKKQGGNWLSWLTSKTSMSVKYIVTEVLEKPLRFIIKIVVAVLLVVALLIKCGLSYCCRAGNRWRKRRARARRVATIAANERRRECRNCGACDHTTANCVQRTRRGISMATRPSTLTHASMTVIMTTTMLSCAESTTYATLWPINTQLASIKDESPTIRITVTPKTGQAVNTNAITDTGASVSVCSKTWQAGLDGSRKE